MAILNCMHNQLTSIVPGRSFGVFPALRSPPLHLRSGRRRAMHNRHFMVIEGVKDEQSICTVAPVHSRVNTPGAVSWHTASVGTP